MGLLSGIFTGRSHTSTLRVLVVSDIHLALNAIQTVKDYLARHTVNIDVILVPGDICNIKGAEYTEKAAQIKAEDDTQNILWSLEQITSKVYYIPGNHDPDSLLENQSQLTKNSTNVHKKVVELAPDLLLAGFGGSVPSYYAPELRKQAWVGYPFKEEEEFKAEWSPFFNEHIKDKFSSQPNAQLLLMTHVGPSGSDTVRYHPSLDDHIILSGSDTLQETFKQELDFQAKTVLNVHGHTHLGKGQSQYTNIPVVNPGSLKEGNWAILTLERVDQKPWELVSTQLLHFNV
ncbi:metallophosphoesterase YsnB [Acrasis kona]|uniref:Metallophosphoesterase YsnB n=1 Tax=Acrasis kona TaxID=1008807 RepID=A0AAW2ZMI8_9EUKA